MYTVLIRGLEFYAHHGVPDEEQVVGHRYKIDLDIEVDGSADETDNVADTLDYGSVALSVYSMTQGVRHRTVEKLARSIADRLLERHPIIQSVTITLVKRLPPAPVIADEAGIRLVVHRQDRPL